MGFLQVLWKYALKWTRYLISIFTASFNGKLISLDLFLIKFILSLWNQQYFAASTNLFVQKPWNFCEMVFFEIRAETDVSTGMAW